jgi:DegV family protein with EDD domain
MRHNVAVVTDSTAYLDVHLAAERGINVVPLQVVIDGQPYLEGRELGPRDIARALRRHAQVSTSQPAPRAFLDAYESAAASGATAIVSVHLSGQLSGTTDVARLAAREAPVPVEVVDSHTLGMGLGYAALAAAEAADRGLAADEVAAAARARAVGSTTLFYVDTLEYLRRGGRIGSAQALIGTALAVKPLLTLNGGAIQLLEKVRTSARAVARLEDHAVNLGRDVPADVAVHHLANAEQAHLLAERLRLRLPNVGELAVTEVGAVIGAHVGPGLLGVVISPR